MVAFAHFRRWLRKRLASHGLAENPSKPARTICRPRTEELEPRILLANDSYLLPGHPQRLFEVEGIIQRRQADFRNEVGVYVVDDAAGRVEGLLPSDPGYTTAALRRAQTLFSRRSRPGTRRTFTLRGGTRLGLYLVQNRNLQAWRSAADRGAALPVYCSFDLANADRFDHVRSRAWNGPTTFTRRFSWEDQTRGGDRDFNDAVFTFGVARELPPLIVPFTALQPTEAELTGFEAGLQGWTAAQRDGSPDDRGKTVVENKAATLHEGDSFNATLSRSFTIPATPGVLSFTYANLAFDTTDPSFINDAFETALLDADGNSLVPTITPGRDSFFNISEGLVPALGQGTTIEEQTVRVDLAGVPSGTVATLVFRLVNNDSDTTTAVTIEKVAFPGPGAEANPAKFYVADAAGTFRYRADGLADGSFAAHGAEPRGIATNAAGDRVWVLDRLTRRIDVHQPNGTHLGSWVATDLVDPQGIVHEAINLWAVDRGTRRVHRYASAQGRTSGTATATDTFDLHADNSSPSDLTTDGATVWVTDDVLDEVFVYAADGLLLGRWGLDTANAEPSGITRDPVGGTELWVVDRLDREVYHYVAGTTYRAGVHIADGTFTLAPGNTSPEAIADPPPQNANGHSLLDLSGRAIFDTADDFRAGTLFNVTAVDDAGEIRLNTAEETEIPPFIWVANSSEGSISRFDTQTGKEVGRYRTGPESLGARLNPSRTAVAGDGSAWVANRSNRDGNTQSSVVRVLLEDFIDRNGNGIEDTSRDLNNDGIISGAEMLPWDANGDGQPDDERIAVSVAVGRNRNNPSSVGVNTVARSIALDAADNVWVGLFNLGQYEAMTPTATC